MGQTHRLGLTIALPWSSKICIYLEAGMDQNAWMTSTYLTWKKWYGLQSLFRERALLRGRAWVFAMWIISYFCSVGLVPMPTVSMIFMFLTQIVLDGLKSITLQTRNVNLRLEPVTLRLLLIAAFSLSGAAMAKIIWRMSISSILILTQNITSRLLVKTRCWKIWGSTLIVISFQTSHSLLKAIGSTVTGSSCLSLGKS